MALPRLRTIKAILYESRHRDLLSMSEGDKLKSRWMIFRDLLSWHMRHGDHCGKYYLYGLDELGADPTSYVSTAEVLAFRKKHSGVPFYQTRLNYSNLLNDKLLFYIFMRAAGILTPTVFGHLDNGMVFDSGFREVGDLLELIKDGEVVIKERFGGQAGRSRGGPDASFFVIREGIVNEASNGKLGSLGAVQKATGSGHWIVQRLIKQHSQLALLNPTSVNTLRAHSFRSGRGISVPAILVKAGKPGSFVDNVQWGGYYSELDVASGRLTGRFRHTSSLFDKSARDDIAQKLAGLRIPYLAEASALAMRAHELLEFVPGIGWDVAITDSGPIIIEGNDRWNLSTLQLFGGARDTLHQLYPDAFLVD